MACISIKERNTLLLKLVCLPSDTDCSLFRQTAGALPRPHGLLHLQHGEFFCPVGGQHLSEGLDCSTESDSGCRRWATVRG